MELKKYDVNAGILLEFAAFVLWHSFPCAQPQVMAYGLH
jgi:hypothetical protein